MSCGGQCENKTKGYRVVNENCRDAPMKRPLLNTLGIKVQPLAPPSILKHITKSCSKYKNEVPSNEIEKFIDDYGVKWQEADKCKDKKTKTECAKQFNTLNDFLIREVSFKVVKPEELEKTQYAVVPFEVVKPEELEKTQYAVVPAFSSVVAYKHVSSAQKLWIKGENFTINEMLKLPEDDTNYNDYSIAIFYLHPSDPHKFYAPVSGKLTFKKKIKGTYYSNDPSSIHSSLDVYGRNKRVVIHLWNKDLGDVFMVLIGSTCIGSIVVKVEVGKEVKMGQEIGAFQFGGSSIVLLFDSNNFKFCETLLWNSGKKISQIMKPGQYLGQYKNQEKMNRLINQIITRPNGKNSYYFY